MKALKGRDEIDVVRSPRHRSPRCLAPLGLWTKNVDVRDPRPALRFDLGCRISPRWGFAKAVIGRMKMVATSRISCFDLLLVGGTGGSSARVYRRVREKTLAAGYPF